LEKTSIPLTLIQLSDHIESENGNDFKQHYCPKLIIHHLYIVL
jgi:hypothetical protein